MASWAHVPEESEERTQKRGTCPHQDRNGNAAHRQVRSQEVRNICIQGEEGLCRVVLTRTRSPLSREEVESHFEGEVLENSNIPWGMLSTELSNQAAI